MTIFNYYLKFNIQLFIHSIQFSNKMTVFKLVATIRDVVIKIVNGYTTIILNF